jgi:hypothetical protein
MKSKYIRNRIVSDVNKLINMAEMEVFFVLITDNNLIMYRILKN